jgi:hypothetical protein
MKTIEERIQEYVANAWVELDQFNEDHVTFENIVTSACVVGANFESAGGRFTKMSKMLCAF